MANRSRDPETHASLVERASSGDPPAIDELLARNLPALRAFLRLRTSRKIRDQESCSDLSQSVCREVLEDIDGFEYRSEAAFRAWLFTKALSKVQDRARYYHAQKRDLRRRSEAVRSSAGEETRYGENYVSLMTPSRAAIEREDLERIENAFDLLPDAQREVLSLSRIAGLTVGEIADRTDRSEGSVRGHLQRALGRLSWILSQRDGES